MSDDLLDLFAGKHKSALKGKPQDPGYHAPIELMSQVADSFFLASVLH